MVDFGRKIASRGQPIWHTALGVAIGAGSAASLVPEAWAVPVAVLVAVVVVGAMAGRATIYEAAIVTVGITGRTTVLIRDVESFSFEVTQYLGGVSGRQVNLSRGS